QQWVHRPHLCAKRTTSSAQTLFGVLNLFELLAPNCVPCGWVHVLLDGTMQAPLSSHMRCRGRTTTWARSFHNLVQARHIVLDEVVGVLSAQRHLSHSASEDAPRIHRDLLVRSQRLVGFHVALARLHHLDLTRTR